jgi:hypothetical protein
MRPLEPMGDQPDAIRALVEGVRAPRRWQTLLGATGTGKTFTIANVIQEVQKPTLVISHNKTLAASEAICAVTAARRNASSFHRSDFVAECDKVPLTTTGNRPLEEAPPLNDRPTTLCRRKQRGRQFSLRDPESLRNTFVSMTMHQV